VPVFSSRGDDHFPVYAPEEKTGVSDMGRLLLPKILFICFFTVALLLQDAGAFPAKAAEDPMKTHLLLGSEKAFNLDEKGAVSELMKAVEIDPQNPKPHAFLAMTYLFFYETSVEAKEKKRNETSLLRAVEAAESRASKRIDKDPKDGEAYFSMALAKMVKNRWEMANKNYFRAFREAQSVWDFLTKAKELDPENYDINYPMGVMHYYLAQLSGVAGWTASVFITSGDREKGLKELELAAEKGSLLKDMAQSTLVSIYNVNEDQPGRALALGQKLSRKYPDNYNYLFGLGDSYSSLGRFEEALSQARQIEKGIKSGAPPYRPELWPRYYHLLGRIYLDEGDYDRAAENLNLALKDTAPYNTRVRAWALVRLGMIHDVRNERKQAEEYYTRALELVGAEGLAQRRAREYLKTPYSPKGIKEKKG
jgi:tetratricopeptide (TPR) repeat protein